MTLGKTTLGKTTLGETTLGETTLGEKTLGELTLHQIYVCKLNKNTVTQRFSCLERNSVGVFQNQRWSFICQCIHAS
jgi:hypothetical protein